MEQKKSVQYLPPQLVELPKEERTAAYARVSGAKDEQLMSLAAQVGYYSELIRHTPGWRYVGIYADEARTGTKENRPEFQRLLQDCRAGKIDRVLVKSISRLARNTVTLLETVRELKALSVDVYFEKEGIHTLSAMGEVLLTIIAAVAQEESRQVSDNCKWRIRRQFANFELAAIRFLYGYRWDGKTLVVAPEEAEVVRRVFADFIAGIGSTAIARRLQRDLVPTLRDGEWTPKRVRMILQQEKFTGNALLQKRFVDDHIQKREVVNRGQLAKYYAEETHPAIITQDIFDKAQEILAANQRKCRAGETLNGHYPFTSVVHCSVCGKHYTRKLNHNRCIWHCSTFMMFGKEACCAKAVPEATLEGLAAEALGLPIFDEVVFKAKVSEVLIMSENRVAFTFRDGTGSVHTWDPHTRRDSWDEAARERARQCAQKRWSK